MSTIDFFRRRLPGFLQELEELVAIETPTGRLTNLEMAAAWLEERLAPFGDLTREAVGNQRISARSAVPQLQSITTELRT